MDKIKVYLDTNTIEDSFINQTLALKQGIPPKVPEKLKFFLENTDKINFMTSIATEAEVSRELIAGYGLAEEQFDRLWKNFLEELNCYFIKEFNIDERFSRLPKKIKMKMRTLVNFIHLFIAMKEDAYLVSGDKDLIKIVRENKIYDKILSYIELRELIASFSQDL
ncbi:MAG: hypothetical protein HYW24_05485 [Candidatus Aenigmarchaeota archaeon]|nr:hypothetical protein [Candidatus Aenigmarchaeota archaeon]